MQQINSPEILEKHEITRRRRSQFNINDYIDIIVEILQRLDGPSLGIATCVCRLWSSVARDDSLWEHLCFRHVSHTPPSGVRPVVVALGGYRRLYMVCVRPVLSRLGESEKKKVVMMRRRRNMRVWARDDVEVHLSLSLFCVDYYERRLAGGGEVGVAHVLVQQHRERLTIWASVDSRLHGNFN